MKSSILISTVVFLFAAAATAAPNILVLRWPPSFCSVPNPRHCKPELISNKFLIRGLWPINLSDEGYECLGGKFNETALARSVEQDLRSAWPALRKGRKDVRLWSREWEYQGACASPPMLIDDYFRKAVALYRSRKFEQDLEKAGILLGKPYSFEKFKERLEKVHLHPHAICKPGRKKDEFLVVELRYCVNDAATKIDDCGWSAMEDGCPGWSEDPRPNTTVVFSKA